jgi:hypothetical protein
VNPELIACLTVGVLSPVVVISVLTICATLVALFATGERAVRAHAVLIYLLDALRALFRCGGGKR